MSNKIRGVWKEKKWIEPDQIKVRLMMMTEAFMIIDKMVVTVPSRCMDRR